MIFKKPDTPSSKVKVQCPQCKKMLTRNIKSKDQTTKSILDQHLKRCYKCENCNTYRVKFSGHSKSCTPERVVKDKNRKEELGYRACPICDIGFHHCLEHIRKAHKVEGADLDKYRMVASRGKTPDETLENIKKLQSAQRKVIVLLKPISLRCRLNMTDHQNLKTKIYPPARAFFISPFLL